MKCGNDKNSIRKKNLALRKSQKKSIQTEKSKLITQQILNSDTFNSAQHISLYHAVNGEADASALVNLDQSKQYYLPIVSAQPNQPLSFAPIKQKIQYKKNKFSIPEPVHTENDLIQGEELDLVITPLVAVDELGNRLGMGGGFYDRTFSFKRNGKEKPVLLGIAYDFQITEILAPEPWDIPLDMLATESRLIIF